MEIHRQDEFGERDSLIDSMFALEEKRQEKKLLSYIPSFFTTASLPFRNVKSPVFVRRGSNGVTLRLTAPRNVPFGKYGRLLLSLLTTHAVLSREKDCQVEIRYEKLGDMLRELELPKSRGREIREQLECFRNATFSFEQRVVERVKASEVAQIYGEGEAPPKDVTVTTHSTGNIRFTSGVQYREVDDGSRSNKFGAFRIVLSPEFASFCQTHAVPIDYNVYKAIDSAAGKDIYAWLVYRNNAIDSPVFVPRSRLVEQFLPLSPRAHPNQEAVNYARILEELKKIRERYYPEVRYVVDPDGKGITLCRSPTPVISEDVRYALITSDI